MFYRLPCGLRPPCGAATLDLTLAGSHLNYDMAARLCQLATATHARGNAANDGRINAFEL